MQLRDRILELRRVRASTLRPHPRNWRTHPRAQQEALRGLLAEVGYVDALLARELPDGALELIDGHLRAETTPDAEVPVLVLDLSDEEAAKVLVTLDPLAALAGTDAAQLGSLLAEFETQNDAVRQLADDLAARAEVSLPDEAAADPPPREARLDELYQVLVQCRDEQDQRELFERLAQEGRRCRLLTL